MLKNNVTQPQNWLELGQNFGLSQVLKTDKDTANTSSKFQVNSKKEFYIKSRFLLDFHMNLNHSGKML